MSAPTSTSSPRSGSISGDALDLGFDGFEDLLRAWAGGLKPDPYLTVSQWADRYRMLASRASAEPGRYRTRRTPYMREIMDALSPSHPAQRVVFMKAAQTGGDGSWKQFFWASSSTRRRGRRWRCSRPWSSPSATRASASIR